MPDTRSEETLMAVLAPKAADLRAGSGTGPAVGRRVAGLPGLDARIETFARMVYGADVKITAEIRALAREQILTAMADDLVDATTDFTPAPQQLNSPAAQFQSAQRATPVSGQSLPLRTGLARGLQQLLLAAATPFTLRRLGMVAVPLAALLVAGSVLTENWLNTGGPSDRGPAANATKMRSLEIQPADSAAEQNLQREIAAEEAAHGRFHPAVARKLVDLASLFAADRRYAEAQALCERALIMQDQALGPSNPETLRTIKELAAIYRAEGRTKEADEILTRTNQP